MRRLCALAAAALLALGLVTALPMAVDAGRTYENAAVTTTGSLTYSTAWNYCQWFNPNPSGYIVSSLDYLNYNGGYNSLVQCRVAPTVTPNLGPLCLQIAIGWIFTPPSVQTRGWYPPPSFACPPI